MGFFVLGFLALAIACVWQSAHYLQRAELYETDPNFRDRAPRIRMTAYCLNAYSAACGLGAVITLLMWIF